MQEELLITLNAHVRTIKFNRPSKKNAITQDMYKAITRTLNEDATNDDVVVTIITGTGEFFTSGNDFVQVMNLMSKGQELDTGVVKTMIQAFINYPKIIIAVVNGPAIGIGTTALALCDIVYASDRATFETPFIKLGLCAEGCSSYLFPRILGRSKASEMLLLGHKLTAAEAYQFGLISQVIPHQKLESFIQELHKFGQLPPVSVKRTKGLATAVYKQTLCECNERESKELLDCFQSDEFFNAINNFMSRKKSKL